MAVIPRRTRRAARPPRPACLDTSWHGRVLRAARVPALARRLPLPAARRHRGHTRTPRPGPVAPRASGPGLLGELGHGRALLPQPSRSVEVELQRLGVEDDSVVACRKLDRRETVQYVGADEGG